MDGSRIQIRNRQFALITCPCDLQGIIAIGPAPLARKLILQILAVV